MRGSFGGFGIPPYKQGCIVISSFGDTFSHRWLVSRIFAVKQWWRWCQLWLNMQPPPQQQQHAQQQHHKPRSNISSCNGNCKQTSEKTLTHSNLKGVFNCVNLTPFMAHQTRTICTPLQYQWNPLFSPWKPTFWTPYPDILLLHVGHVNYCRATVSNRSLMLMFSPLHLPAVLIIHSLPFQPISIRWMDSFIWDIVYLPTACSLYAGQTRLLVVACLNIGNCQCASSDA